MFIIISKIIVINNHCYYYYFTRFNFTNFNVNFIIKVIIITTAITIVVLTNPNWRKHFNFPKFIYY